MRVSDEHKRLGWFALDALDTLKLPEGYRRSIRAVTAEPGWLAMGRELQAMAQTGLHYTKDKYDADRYARLRLLATEMMAAGSGSGAETIAALFDETGYATPKLAVRAACFRDDRILMVRETTDGLWSVPGGWCDVNESASECIEREIREESGFTARAVKLAAVWDRSRHGHPPLPFTIYILYFLCELTGGAPKTSIETSEIGFFAEHELPPLSSGRIQSHQIRRMFAHHRQSDLPTDFD
jgi:ADP-ribose pyrophosphatase YjhB (NUDIX family)